MCSGDDPTYRVGTVLHSTLSHPILSPLQISRAPGQHFVPRALLRHGTGGASGSILPMFTDTFHIIGFPIFLPIPCARDPFDTLGECSKKQLFLRGFQRSV